MYTDTSKEAIRSIQKRICSTPFPDGFQSIADDAYAMIDALAAKLADADRATRYEADVAQQAIYQMKAEEARAEASEAMLPRAYRAGVEEAAQYMYQHWDDDDAQLHREAIRALIDEGE